MLRYSLAGLLCDYDANHPDYQSANMAMIKMQTIIRKMTNRLRESVSLYTLVSSSSIVQTVHYYR